MRLDLDRCDSCDDLQKGTRGFWRLVEGDDPICKANIAGQGSEFSDVDLAEIRGMSQKLIEGVRERRARLVVCALLFRVDCGEVQITEARGRRCGSESQQTQFFPRQTNKILLVARLAAVVMNDRL